MSKKDDVVELTQEEVEAAHMRSAMNHGASNISYLQDPDTAEWVRIDIKNPSQEAIDLLTKLYKDKL